jgi:hypothetical protein
MNAYRGVDAQHPHFVAIPDAQVEGVRTYREPDHPNPLQIRFLEEAGEQAWIEEIRGLLSAGRTGEAEALLTAELEGFDGALARLCKSVSSADVALDGWDDLLPILEEWEGPAITAITLGLTNPPDLVFEPGKLNEPELLIGLYSDEAFRFSRSSKADLLAECAKEMPAWVGQEEDVEFYCQLAGAAELNTALVHCKHRHFLRDGRDGVEGRAPGGYVEYVLGSWFLATRFLQAAERAIVKHELPEGCRLIAGSIEVGADFVSVSGPEEPFSPAAETCTERSQPSLATLTVKPWVPREDPTADAVDNAPTLRQRLRSVEPEPTEPPRAGFLARMFRRFRGKQV